MTLTPPPLTDARVAERGRVDAATFAVEVLDRDEPIILRGQFDHWPAVAAGHAGQKAIADYVSRFSATPPVEVMIGDPAIGGRFFYAEDMETLNFGRHRAPLAALIAELLRVADIENPHALYASAASIAAHMQGWAEENPLDLPLPNAIGRIWVGNAVQVATHYDLGANLAVVVAGQRRFTLFPPEQLTNLYVGPLERTLAGPPASMVDPEGPDLDRYPKFATAIQHAQVAELEPGDALFIPSLWWHHVRSFAAINVLVNYWPPADAAHAPFPAFIHALMGVRDLPAREKRAWRAWFEHYVFADDAALAGAHLPEQARGFVGADSPVRAAAIRQFLTTALKSD